MTEHVPGQSRESSRAGGGGRSGPERPVIAERDPGAEHARTDTLERLQRGASQREKRGGGGREHVGTNADQGHAAVPKPKARSRAAKYLLGTGAVFSGGVAAAGAGIAITGAAAAYYGAIWGPELALTGMSVLLPFAGIGASLAFPLYLDKIFDMLGIKGGGGHAPKTSSSSSGGGHGGGGHH